MNAIQPLDPRLPNQFPPPWAFEWGEDEKTLFAVFKVKEIAQLMRWMPPGRFMMGSPSHEPGREPFGYDETLHPVTLTRGFWLADTACTQALWEAVMGDNPSDFKGPERPVDSVRWNDSQRFIEALNESLDGDGAFRLPREAEWEYACRAGTTTPFWFGHQITTDQVNYNGNYPYTDGAKGKFRQETVDVKALPANGWGLYQMHGNVMEWCQGRQDGYGEGHAVDPQDPASGDERVLRGGHWYGLAWFCRSAYRGAYHPAFRNHNVGFRLARGDVMVPSKR
ncbi:MAG: formylglycine-generating enzyme family protein [Candidatus Competibacterales bacterium]